MIVTKESPKIIKSETINLNDQLKQGFKGLFRKVLGEAPKQTPEVLNHTVIENKPIAIEESAPIVVKDELSTEQTVY